MTSLPPASQAWERRLSMNFAAVARKASDLVLQFGRRQVEAVGQRHLAALEPFVELEVVIADHAAPAALGTHPHHEAQDIGVSGAAIGEVADEEGDAPFRMTRGEEVFTGRVEVIDCVTEAGHQFGQFIEAAVNVADDVEGAVLAAAVGPERLADDFECVCVLWRAHHMDVAKALAAEAFETAAQGAGMVARHVRAEGPVRAALVAGVTDVGVDIEDEGDREGVMPAGKRNKAGAIGTLDTGCVDDGELAALEAQAGPVMQQVEGVRCRVLAGLIIGDQSTALIGRDDFRFQKMFPRKARFAGAGRADQDNEREIGNCNLHAPASPDTISSGGEKTAIWEGAPWVASTGPRSAKLTA